MTTDELLGIVEERGIRLKVDDGRLVIVNLANNPEVTDALLAVLKIHRDWIIERLQRCQR